MNAKTTYEVKLVSSKYLSNATRNEGGCVIFETVYAASNASSDVGWSVDYVTRKIHYPGS